MRRAKCSWRCAVNRTGLRAELLPRQQESNGYRQHAHSDKYSLGGKWFLTSEGGALKAGIVARLYFPPGLRSPAS